MLIVPFIHKITEEKDMNIHNIKILTIGGKYLWEESEEPTRILHSNNIYSKHIVHYDNTYLCEVDLEKTDMNDMYHWNELDINDNETFCWRNYIYFSGKNKECWLQYPKSEKMGDIINKIIGI
jgi:hypothetical protein